MAGEEVSEGKKKQSAPKGIGAQKGSSRREFRRFRPRPPKKEGIQEKSTESTDAAANTNEKSTEILTAKKKNTRLCRYFNTPGGCRLGNDCLYKHKPKKVIVIPADKIEEVEKTAEEHEIKKIVVPLKVERKPVVLQKQIISKESEGSEEQKSLKITEETYFKRRYRHAKVESTESQTSISFRYEITDPEWVFDIRSMEMTLILDNAYPLIQPTVVVSENHNTSMPDVLRKHIMICIAEFIQNKYDAFISQNAYEIIGKALIRFMERNILKMFVNGLTKLKMHREAEAAGISLVLPSTTDVGKENDEKTEVVGEQDHSLRDQMTEMEVGDDDVTTTQDLMSELAQEVQHVTIENSNEKLPLEVFLVWDDLSQNIASIIPVLLQIATKCGRCRADALHDVPCNNKPVAWRCTKCSTAQSLRLRACILHPHSPVLAHLDARGCVQLDCILMNSRMKFTCLACNKEDNVQNINTGQAHKSWCRSCHTSCEFIVAAVRFRGDFSLGLQEDKEAASRVPKAKKTQVENRTAVTPGQPLPFNGTCKHYKKSFRWFRFPCCGRTFPCDTCHEEAGLGHEIKVANRQICGHCSSEQPFQKDKPCSNCNSAIIRKKSQFWEGGKGCRNQQVMSRNDGHKFSGSRKKTVAKVKVEKLVTKKS